jgi:hypothetical protein
MRLDIKQVLLAALSAVALSLGAAATPAAAAVNPLFVFTPPPSEPGAKAPPPTGNLDGPCGVVVDVSGDFFVSDYYHHVVDVFAGNKYLTQLAGVDPLDGPCGLALASNGKLYVNDYHRSVIRYIPSAYPPSATTTFSTGVTVDSQDPTGVAVGSSGNVYVNDRTYIAIYNSFGVPLSDGEGNPLKIGLGTLGDGYGVAVSGAASTVGRIYVPDASTNTVKVYDLGTSAVTPVASITGPPGGFSSLADSAIAVDAFSGDVYVADRTGSPFAERPESTIQVFDSGGAYIGHLKYNVVDAAPVGLAVDNSATGNSGRVYVTSGNTEKASIYAYGPGSATTTAPLPPPAAVGSTSEQSPAKASSQAFVPTGPPTPGASEGRESANLLLNVNGQLAPQTLPHEGAAPISISVGWSIATSDGTPPPKLEKLAIEINRAGHFDLTGLPACPYDRIRSATTSKALSKCRSALVGRGSFQALSSHDGQESRVTKGQMLVFNGLEDRKPVLFGQIYSPRLFANSFVIAFALSDIAKGRYGSVLSARLPKSLRAWGSLTKIQMRLFRRFGYEGKQHSFLSAGCPASNGFTEAVFPLARTSLDFGGGLKQSSTLMRSCRARG